jgi:single-strand DNA-binding protein
MKTLRNHVQLIGNLGKDVECISFESDRKKATVSLATNEFYKDKKGELVQQTQWHNLVAWGKTADLMASVLKKGHEVAVSGKLAYRNYEDKDGTKRYVSEIVVQEFLRITRENKEESPF